MDEVYQIQAPSLAQYHAKERENPEKSIKELGQYVIDSGLFEGLIYEQLVCEITYRIENYLALLKSYSVYIALDDEKTNYLLANLREVLENNWGNSIQAYYLSAFHVAQKT